MNTLFKSTILIFSVLILSGCDNDGKYWHEKEESELANGQQVKVYVSVDLADHCRMFITPIANKGLTPRTAIVENCKN